MSSLRPFILSFKINLKRHFYFPTPPTVQIERQSLHIVLLDKISTVQYCSNKTIYAQRAVRYMVPYYNVQSNVVALE